MIHVVDHSYKIKGQETILYHTMSMPGQVARGYIRPAMYNKALRYLQGYSEAQLQRDWLQIASKINEQFFLSDEAIGKSLFPPKLIWGNQLVGSIPESTGFVGDGKYVVRYEFLVNPKWYRHNGKPSDLTEKQIHEVFTNYARKAKAYGKRVNMVLGILLSYTCRDLPDEILFLRHEEINGQQCTPVHPRTFSAIVRATMADEVLVVEERGVRLLLFQKQGEAVTMMTGFNVFRTNRLQLDRYTSHIVTWRSYIPQKGG